MRLGDLDRDKSSPLKERDLRLFRILLLCVPQKEGLKMFQRTLIIVICTYAMLLGDITIAQQKIQLNVSAFVPPHPCTYPERCDPVGPSVITRVTVGDGVIRYVGPRPSVTYTDDMITIIF